MPYVNATGLTGSSTGRRIIITNQDVSCWSGLILGQKNVKTMAIEIQGFVL